VRRIEPELAEDQRGGVAQASSKIWHV
jgi:hypothetical protein